MSTFTPSPVVGFACAALVGCALGCSSPSDDSSDTGPLAPTGVRFDTTGNDSAVCQSALFCDDFEAFAAGAPPAGAWTANQNNGTVSVDTVRAFRGKQAVKASTIATGATTVTYKAALIGLTRAPVVPVPNDTVYGRMMFYLESAPSTDVHWTFIDGAGTVPGQDYSATYRYGGQKAITDAAGVAGNQLMANYDTTDFYSTPPKGPQTDCYQHADAKVVPTGRWACAQWLFDGPNAQMRFWLDGQELTDLHVDGTGEGCVVNPPVATWTAPTFSRLDVGWESYQADDARSIWIDDVVFSATPVSCPFAAAGAQTDTQAPRPSGY